MSDGKGRLDRLVQDLKGERDELKLKIHLGQADARDQWDELENQWRRLDSKLAAARKEAGAAGKDIGAAASLLAEQIAAGYKRIRKRL